jgi:hypothetical protein
MTRDRPDADQVLQEYEVIRDPAGDPGREAVKAAIFIEDVFGITLSDAEIEPEALGTLVAMRALIARRQSPR